MRRSWLLLGIAAIVIAVFIPGGSRAGKPETPGETFGGQTAKDPHEESPDLFKRALDLTVWTIVVFLVLLIVLTKFAWKPMLAGLQQREHNIHAAQEEAKRDREEAQRLRDEVRRKLDGAAVEIRDMLDKGRREAQQLQEDMMNKARAEIQAERDRLRREIETARDQAVQELWNQTAELATLISAKAIRRQLSPDDHRRLVDEALAELGPAGEQRRDSSM
jgi:F-type H+-transporting ATPase subunit b